jgi:Ras-related protein Rab-1A
MTYTPNPNATNVPQFLYVEVVEARTSKTEQSTMKNPIVKLKFEDEKYKAEFLDHGETIIFAAKFKFKLHKESISSMLIVSLYDKDTKIGSTKIPLSEVQPGTGTYDKWFPLFEKSKKTQTGEVHLLLSNGTPLKKKSRKSNVIAGANTFNETNFPHRPNKGNMSEEAQLSRSDSGSFSLSESFSMSRSTVENTEDSSFNFSSSESLRRKKRRSAFKFITAAVKSVDGALRPVTIGRLYVSLIEARLEETNPMTPQNFLCICFFEKQKVATDLTKGPNPKWNDNFVFTVKDLKSEFKAVVYKENEKSENVIAKTKISLSELEEKKPLKKWFDLKSRKQKLSVGKILMRFKYEPYLEPMTDSDEEEEDIELMEREPVGTLTLDIIEARNLSTTHHSREPNPYCIVKCQRQQFQTQFVKNTSNPKWNESFSLNIRTHEAKLRFTVWDKDKKADGFLGIAIISVGAAKGPDFVYDEWVPLQKRSIRNNVTGDIHIRFKVEYTNLQKKQKDDIQKERRSLSSSEQSPATDNAVKRMSSRNMGTLSEQSESLEESSDVQSTWSQSSHDLETKPTTPRKTVRGKLKVTIVEAKDLFSKNKSGDVFCKCIYAKNEYTTQTMRKTTNPQWNETIDFQITDIYAHKLRVGVFSISKNGQKYRGHVSIPLSFLADRLNNVSMNTNTDDNSNECAIVDKWYSLEKSTKLDNNRKILKKKEPRGSLRIRLEFVQKKPELFSPETQIEDSSKYDQIYKVILVGNTGVGKTSLFRRYMKDEYSEHITTSCGVDFETKTYKINDKVVKVQLWDTAGQERFKTITRQYYRGAMGVVVVYDITDRKSFQRLDWWINEVKQFTQNTNCFMILVGNKCDCKESRVVQTQEGIDFANKHNMSFLETSAKDRTNVDEAFRTLLTEIYEFGKEHELPTVSDNPYVPTEHTIMIKGNPSDSAQPQKSNISRCRC